MVWGELCDDNELNALTSFGNFTGEHVQNLASAGRDSHPGPYIPVCLNCRCSDKRCLESLSPAASSLSQGNAGSTYRLGDCLGKQCQPCFPCSVMARNV